MTADCRAWWRNCAMEADAEIQEIDRLEDRITPLDANVTRIRELISTLELCHHKAERWIDVIIEAIGKGQTEKGLGTRTPGRVHPAETVWVNACAALSAWCAGCPADAIDVTVGDVTGSVLLSGLGPRSPLKEWQLQRVVEKIRSLIGWPQSDENPASAYVWLLIGEGAYELAYQSECPSRYREHEEFWRATACTLIHDTHAGQEASLSLALGIDMLWPCHWRFVENLHIVLDAIGGELHPEKPFAACGRNITLVPNRPRYGTICATLRAFCDVSTTEGRIDRDILTQLGKPTDTKKWLALSLDKTIRLQMDPSPQMQALSTLDGPAWTRQ